MRQYEANFSMVHRSGQNFSLCSEFPKVSIIQAHMLRAGLGAGAEQTEASDMAEDNSFMSTVSVISHQTPDSNSDI